MEKIWPVAFFLFHDTVAFVPIIFQYLIQALKHDEFDVLVVGGGATGAGVALDAQSRGLSTALVEYNDFASGTSSRSTKLIHGGVRYLQAAILKLDSEQYHMVKEALFERANLLQCAPHLAFSLPIMLPIYNIWQIPYYWFGIKMYDFVSGKRVLRSSYYINKEQALERFPLLNYDSLKGALIYYDGMHNDARMNMSIILTAIRLGAKAVNHTKVEKLLKDGNGKLCGAHVKDMLTGEEWDVKAKVVINATGPFTDTMRLMADPDSKPICQPSAGVHIILPRYFCPTNTGLLDPATSDGRVIFFLPWEGMTIAGTTDAATAVTFNPSPSDVDIEFILREIRSYLSDNATIRRGDVMSAWAGLRPLVRDPNKTDTKSLARNHIIEVGKSGLVTIAGGKWTTYRHMAEETVDTAVRVHGLKQKNSCVTAGLLLEGAHNWKPMLHIRLVQDFGLEEDVAEHLSRTYGDQSYGIAKMCRMTGKRWPLIGHKLHPEFPYFSLFYYKKHYFDNNFVKQAVKEYACTAVDVIARRLRLAFLNTFAAHEVLPNVVEIMGNELGWDEAERAKQLADGHKFIDIEMGQNARMHSISAAPVHLTKDELQLAKDRFKLLDYDKKGHITAKDLKKFFKENGEVFEDPVLNEIVKEVDFNKNGVIEENEFIALYGGLKGGQIAQNRLARYLEQFQQRTVVPVERSGGGV
uniref:Glycerol-3-phosphate dehydrogenase n=1 Tax=Syphacia muris TaxID=451379 RepID=A0A0N5APN6_9BILA